MTIAIEQSEAHTDLRSLLTQVAVPVRAVDTDRINELHAEYSAWSDERTGLSAAEGDDDAPTADEWHHSDNDAVRILEKLAAALGFNAAA